MEEAIPLGNMTDLHYYARSLVNMKKAEEGFKVFKLNYDKRPDELRRYDFRVHNFPCQAFLRFTASTSPYAVASASLIISF